jgi:hypothetical protein
VTSHSDTAAVAAFCPYCGNPLGSFFGTRTAEGARLCDRCGECFEVIRVEIDESTNKELD